MNEESLTRALESLLPGWRERDVTWTRTSNGYVHDTYVASSGADTVVLKLIDEKMLSDVTRCDLTTLIANTRLAGTIGIGAPVLGVGHEPPCLALTFLPGRTLESGDLADPAMLDRVVSTVRKLHEQPVTPDNAADPFVGARHWTSALQRLHSPWAPAFARLAQPLADIERALLVRGTRPCFTHNDVLAANFIDRGDQVHLIDYDYAGLGDPALDLGNLVAESNLPASAQQQICRTYFSREDDRDVAVLRLSRTASDIAYGALIAFADAGYPDKFGLISSELSAWIEQKLTTARIGVDRDDFAADLGLAATQSIPATPVTSEPAV